MEWYDQSAYNLDEALLPLRKFADKRISIALRKSGIRPGASAWNSLFQETMHYPRGNEKTTFKHLLDHTLYRPREIITFLNHIGNRHYSIPVSSHDIDKVIDIYVENLVQELKNELILSLSRGDVDMIFDTIFPELPNVNATISVADFELLLSKHLSGPPGTYISILLKYGVIGYKTMPGDRIYSAPRVSMDKLGRVSNNANIFFSMFLQRYDRS